MKQISYLRTAILCCTLSCINPEDGSDIPFPTGVAPEISANSSFQALVQAFLQSEKEIFVFPSQSKAVVEAYVISSDEGGNFFKSLVVQDHWSEPSMGLLIKINLRAYYAQYQRGRRILLSMAGLAMSKENGIYTIGYLNRQRLEPIPEGLLDDFILETDQWQEIKARNLNKDELEHDDLLTMVRFGLVQFSRDELGKSFSAERYDSYYAVRGMVDCAQGLELDLITSTYADFKAMLLPEGIFEAQGILTTGRNNKLALELISPEFLLAKEGERCDPYFLNCNKGESKGSQVLFYEDFDDLSSTSGLEERGWINRNANFRNEKFRKRTENGNGFLRISAYGSAELVMEAWLISPLIDLDASENEVLSFRTRATYQEGRALSVWVCPDYGYDPESASWERLDCLISDGSSDGSNKIFVSSGKVDLSCLSGSVRIGFRYLGGDPGVSTTYDLDNFLIMGTAQN